MASLARCAEGILASVSDSDYRRGATAALLTPAAPASPSRTRPSGASELVGVEFLDSSVDASSFSSVDALSFTRRIPERSPGSPWTPRSSDPVRARLRLRQAVA
jgi:hypothetical protein